MAVMERAIIHQGWSVSPEKANEIMGNRLFTPHVIAQLLGDDVAGHPANLRQVKYTEPQLQANKDTHVLIPCPQVTLGEMMTKPVFAGIIGSWPQDLIYSPLVTEQSSNSGWSLVRVGLHPGTEDKTVEDQELFLGPQNVLPTLVVAIWKCVLSRFFVQRDILGTMCMRTSTQVTVPGEKEARSLILRQTRATPMFLIELDEGVNVRSPAVGAASMVRPTF